MASRRRATSASVAAFILCQFALAVVASDLSKSDTKTTSESTDSGESTEGEDDRPSPVPLDNVFSVIRTESSSASQHRSSRSSGEEEGIVLRPQETRGLLSVHHAGTEGITGMHPGGDTPPTAHASSFAGTQHGRTNMGSLAMEAEPRPGEEREEVSLANIEDGNAHERRRPQPRLFGLWRRLRCSGVRSRRDGHISTTAKAFVLVVFFVFTLLCGAIFGGFPPLAGMMARDGAFSDLCPLNSTSSNTTTGSLAQTTLLDGLTANGTIHGPASGANPYQCELQRIAINNLYTPSLSVACVTSFVAGFLIDRLGPRATHLFGSTAHLAGLFFLGFGLHAVGLLMMSGGQQTMFLSTLSLAQYFPNRQSTIVGLLGALASLSQLVPVVMLMAMSRLNLSLWDVMMWYVTAIAVPALVAGGALLPSRHTTGGSTGDELTPERTMQNEGTAHNRAGRRLLRRLADLLRTLFHSMRMFVRDSELRGVIYSRETAFAIFVFAIASIASSFFIIGADRTIPGYASNHLAFAFPLAALPCALLGQLADKFGSSVAMMVLGLAGLLMNIFSFLPSNAAGYIVLVALTTYISAQSSQVIWFSNEAAPRRYASTFAGVVLTTGGILSLLANTLYSDVAVGMLGGNTAPVRMGLVILQVLVLLMMFLEHRRLRRRQRQHGHGELRRGRMRRQETPAVAPHPRIRELPDK